jgi:beta-galactosidase GanA
VKFLLLICILAAAAVRAAETDVTDSFGVNIHFTDPKPGEMKMLADTGFKWVRMDLNWGGTERKKGEYDFRAYDRLMTALATELRGYTFEKRVETGDGGDFVLMFRKCSVNKFAAWTTNAAPREVEISGQRVTLTDSVRCFTPKETPK